MTKKRSRRTKGDGSIYRRKDGKWCAQLNSTYRYSITEEGARAKLYKLLAGVEEAKPENTTVNTVCSRWYEFQAQNVKPSTSKRYSEIIRLYIEPNLGHVKAHSPSLPMQVQSLYGQMLTKQRLSATSVNLVHTVLSSAFKKAVKWGMVTSNPIALVDAPRIVRTEVEVFDPEEVHRLLTAAKYEPLEAVYVLALSCACRGGEILSLKPKDYDPVAGTLSIRRTLIMNGTGVGPPKSKNSRRTISLPQIAQDSLSRCDMSGEWMFPTSVGTTYFYHNFISAHWRKLCARASVPYRNFHTCRHYAISTMLLNGVPLSSTARYAGDTEISILRAHSHIIKGHESIVPTIMDTILEN